MARKKPDPAPKKPAERADHGGDGWNEEESSLGVPWWYPEDDGAVLVVQILSASDSNKTRYGDRSFFLCRVLEDTTHADEDKPELKKGDTVIVWESAALRELSRWVGEPVAVKIVSAGRGGQGGRTKLYRFFTKPMRGAQRGNGQDPNPPPQGRRGKQQEDKGDDIPF